MRTRSTIRKRRPEAGIALLIAIFVLLLISVVAIALIVSSGTESALAGNYRGATSVYYAALAGLEEGRGRLSNKNSNSFTASAPGFLPSPGIPLAIGSVAYVLNPSPTEALATLLATYPDTEYDNEFGGGALAGATVTTTASIWNSSPLNALGVPGPLHKWVRINAVSEKSLNIDVDADFLADSIAPLYYDGTHFSNNPSAGPQVLEITSLAVLPNGSQKLLQYLVAPNNLNLSFPSAITLDSGSFSGTNFYDSGNSDFDVNGNDQQHGGNCTPVEPQKYAVGTTNSGSVSEVINYNPGPQTGIPTAYGPLASHYLGIKALPTDYSVGDISASLIPVFQTESSLDNVSPPGLVQILSAPGVADHVILGPASNADLDFGSPTRMVTTVVTGGFPNGGDLTLTGSVNGYGLLVVTGDLTLSGSASWHGVILVIGQGRLIIPSYGHGKIDGAVLIARTRHNNYSLRLSLGTVTFNITNPNYGNTGFYYNSCWVQAALPFGAYKILSFHEIPQP